MCIGNNLYSSRRGSETKDSHSSRPQQRPQLPMADEASAAPVSQLGDVEGSRRTPSSPLNVQVWQRLNVPSYSEAKVAWSVHLCLFKLVYLPVA